MPALVVVHTMHGTHHGTLVPSAYNHDTMYGTSELGTRGIFKITLGSRNNSVFSITRSFPPAGHH